MRSLALCAMALCVAGPVAADNFVDGLLGVLGSPTGVAMMFVHGRDATGVGPAFSFELLGQPWAHADLGIVFSSRGNQRMIPGVSLDVARSALATVAVGAAVTPSEYGGTDLGPLGVRNICPYGAIRRAW